jgi:hypothetical protein
MADNEVIVKIGTDIDAAKKDLESVKNSVEDIGKSTDEGTKATKKMAGGLKGIGVAIKAAGIGLLLKGLQMLADVFMQNQKTADFFNTAFEAVSIALNDFVNFILDNTDGVVSFFKDIFENPLDSIKSLGTAIKDNLIERFNSLIEASGFLAEAMIKVFKGDFKGAVASAKEAGKEFVDVMTGVDNSTEKITNGLNKAVEASTKYVKATVNSAKTNVQLAKSAKLAQAQLQGVIERYDTAAERQRQLRDDETASFEARIAANDMLGATLEAQFVEMTKLAELKVKAAQADYNKLKNDENLIALMEAKNELAGVEAQITGFRSEQLTNQVSLERELAEAKKEVYLAGLDARELEIAETNAHYDELVKLAKKAGEDVIQIEKQRANALKIIHLNEQAHKAGLAADTAGQIADIAGRETTFGKAAAVAQATMNTYQGATKALADLPPPLGAIMAVLTVAQGLINVNKIATVQEPTANFATGGMVSGFGTGTSDSVNARLSKGESVINARSTRMFKPLLSAINEAGGGSAFADNGTLEGGSMGMTGGVVKAYVVADEMTNTQDRLSKIRRRATI